MRFVRSAALLVAVAAAVTAAGTRGTGAERAPELGSINADDLRRHVGVLTSDRMDGRLVGTAGNRRATEFIASRYEELELGPVGPQDTFLHPFTLITTALGRAQAFRVHRDGETHAGELGVDFHPSRDSGNGHARGQAVFVGFGIVAPSLEHNDYGEVDVRGRVVVALDHEPGEHDPASPFDGTRLSEHARSVRKALEAQRRGAVALLLVPDVPNHAPAASLRSSFDAAWPPSPGRVPRYQLGAWTGEIRIPVIRVSAEQAEALLAAPGRPIETLARAAERRGGIRPIQVPGAEVEIAAELSRDPSIHHNVVGVVRGTDPLLRDEWIIVCAHLDHEGRTPRGIFRGADDDASGVAGVIEVAEAYRRAAGEGQHPRRSVLFATWNAEERGLLGAWAYTEDPLVPLDNTVAVLNMDMIGRHEEVPEAGGTRFRGLPSQTAASNRNAVNVLGYSFSTGLREAAAAANQHLSLDLRFRYDDSASNLVRRSDHWPFLFRGVPAVFVHTGLHPDYHTERDTPDKLDYDKMARVTRLVYQMSWELAHADVRPVMR